MSAPQKNPYAYEIENPVGLNSPESPAQRFPIIVFLHGKGECAGDKGKQVRKHGPWKDREFNVNARDRLGRYFVIAPHISQVNGTWEVNRILDTLCVAFEQIKKENGSDVIDIERVYVTGISRGGKGALELAQRGFPDPTLCDPSKCLPFKAAAIICPERGSSVTTNEKTIYQFFHRENDSNPPTRGTYANLNAPPHARFHVYRGCNHNCWTATYAKRSLYDWFADPGTQPDWGDACDFDMCVEAGVQPVQVGRKPINASFCKTHAAQVEPWLRYSEKLRSLESAR